MKNNLKINVLGTYYSLTEADEQTNERLKGKDGYCDTSTKECVVESMEFADFNAKANLPEYKKSVKRHELIHAFLFESGLSCSSWAANEEIVDWIACQFPKLMKAFEETKSL